MQSTWETSHVCSGRLQNTISFLVFKPVLKNAVTKGRQTTAELMDNQDGNAITTIQVLITKLQAS